ncbi:hypothetical protein COU91_00030 [Candidatus Saccharibacteria bacterium CG10_big_fil_rev_8_21_14_0_10_47_8]|nr:MAG: hypothetical protein COU91_00030 [Candidatus Saccharibacteria bacterium CG10_big_fil_rev_8_21_14_0_10_47_8]
MADIAALGRFIKGLAGERLFIAGINGVTGMVEMQTNNLRLSFVQYAKNAGNEKYKQKFLEALYTAQAVSVITDKELKYCEDLLE